MANNDFDLPRPTVPVPSSSSIVANDNSKVLDYVVNSEGTVVTRTGKTIPTLDKVLSGLTLDALGYAPTPVNGGVWTSGQEFNFYNEYMIYNGEAYSPLPATVLPYTVGAIPDLGFVYQIRLNDAYSIDWNNKTIGYNADDWRGFTEALYAETDTVDNGLPDTAIASQRLDAMKATFDVYGTVADLASGKFQVGKRVAVTDRGNGVFLVGAGGVETGTYVLSAGPSRTAELTDKNGIISYYGDLSDGAVINNAALQGAANHVGFVVIPKGVSLRVSTIPETLTSISGGGRLIWDNNAPSLVTYTMPPNFSVKDVEIETIYRNRLAIKADYLKVSGVVEIQSDTRTDMARYNCVEWLSDTDVSVALHETRNTGLRVRGGGVVTIDYVVARVNHVGEGPDGDNHGCDAIKASGTSGTNISNIVSYGSSRDIIDTYIGGGACNINNVWGDTYYFNQIEIKSEGILAPDNDITPHDINISNIRVGSGGKGSASNFAALLIFNQNEGSILNSPRRVNVTNWNSRLIGTTASATYHGIYALDVYSLNLVNVNLLSAKNYGMTLTRCKSVKMANSNIHGVARGGNFVDVTDISLVNSSLGEDLEAASISSYGAFFSGVSSKVKVSNSTIKGTTRGISGEAATVNKLKISNSEVFGVNRIDIFSDIDISNTELDGNSTTSGSDVFLSSASTPSTKLKIMGGTIKNGRYGVNQQSLNKFVCIGVDFEGLSSPMGGVVANNNRRIIGCLSDGSGVFPTASGSDVIVNNIVI